MKFFFILCLSVILTHVESVPPTRVIEIITWDPLEQKDISQDNIPENFKKLLEESYIHGQMLVDADKLGFYDTLEQTDVKYFSSNKFTSYALSYANFEGLLSRQSGKEFSDVMEEISQLKLEQLDSEKGIYTVSSPERDLNNVFRAIDSSLLLESSSFDCENKRFQIQNNKQNLPVSVEKACALVTQYDKKKSIASIQDVMDLYRNTERNRDIPFGKLENCIEQFTFATYYSNDLLIKLNAGELLTEFARILSSNNTSTKLFSYTVPSDAFLAVLTAIQKAALSKSKKSIDLLSHRLYMGSLKKLDKKILFEAYKGEESDPETLRIMIQSQNNQLLFTMDIELDRFISEIGPFLIEDYTHFKEVCTLDMSAALDLRELLLPKDSSRVFGGYKVQLTFLLIIIAIVIIVLAINYKRSAPEKNAGDKREVEFKRVRSDDSEQDYPIGGASKRIIVADEEDIL